MSGLSIRVQPTIMQFEEDCGTTGQELIRKLSDPAAFCHRSRLFSGFN